MDANGTMPKLYYRICVQERLDERRAIWFEGMEVTTDTSGDSLTTTTLTGPVADQAALYGLLSRIRDLGLALVSVNRIPKPPVD